MKLRILLVFTSFSILFLFSGLKANISPAGLVKFTNSVALAAKPCYEDPRDGAKAESSVATTGNALREEKKVIAACSGTDIISRVICGFSKLFANFSTSGTDRGKLTLQNSQMPSYLRAANSTALSYSPSLAELFYGDSEATGPKALTGSIAKMLPPGYTEDGIDPLSGLIAAEGQLAKGSVVLNNTNKQTNFVPGEGLSEIVNPIDDKLPPFYDLEAGEEQSPYLVSGYFGEVVPLYDRFGLIKQALTAPGEKVSIPDPNSIDCPTSEYDPTVIDVTAFGEANRNRDVFWQAEGDIKSDESKSCSTDAEGNVISCPAEGENTYTTGGELGTQSQVSLASNAWKRLGAASNSPGEGGVYNILLPPDNHFRTDEAKEPTIPFTYDPHLLGSTYRSQGGLYIADLGNVEGASSCIVNQLTAHPAVATQGACENAFEFFPGISISCTDEAEPLPFSNSAGSGIARRAWEIVNNLYQGFWCMWNWSKKDYPSIFDEALFRQNPNPTREQVQNDDQSLFWCTWLVWKVQSNHGPSLNSQAMKNYYESQGRFIAPQNATVQNVRPGYVVFFDVFNSINRLDHVGVVYSVTPDSLTFVQSNAGTKSDTITFNAGGTGVQNLPWARVGGFGRP